jgi:hypothetical protein
MKSQTAETHPFCTQVYDVFIDGQLLPVVGHASEAVARRYAEDMSNRRRAEVHVLRAKDSLPVAKYVDGIDEMA